VSTVTLRRMRWWDVDDVVALESTLFGADPWSAEAFWSELAGIPESRFYLVAQIGGALVGYAGLLTAGTTADVQTIAVAERSQRDGVGALLLEALVAEARRRGCEALLLEVRAANEPALALYRKFGFAELGVRRGYYQPGNIDAVVMRLTVS
jgi:[ribosomal protein S18]-alanine N-acetyltransferase